MQQRQDNTKDTLKNTDQALDSKPREPRQVNEAQASNKNLPDRHTATKILYTLINDNGGK